MGRNTPSRLEKGHICCYIYKLIEFMAYDPSKWFSYSKLYDQNTDETRSSNFYDGKSKPNQIQDFQYSQPLTSFYDQSNVPGSSTPSNIYLSSSSNWNQNVDEYDPCSPALTTNNGKIEQSNNELQKPDPRKLDHFITKLQKMIRPLSHEFKRKLPYDMICQLAHSILDGTVFEIAKGLQDIQKITEKNLFSKRQKVTHEHKQLKSEISKRHQKEIESSQNKPHRILVLEKTHNEELKNFQERCCKELTMLDQKIILELDQQMSDQQATLQRAGLPLFYITNDPDDIHLQIYVLDFIMKLAAG